MITLTRRDLLVGLLATALLTWALVIISIQAGRDLVAIKHGDLVAVGCEYIEPYQVDGRQTILHGNVVHGYPGGWHWRVECADGNVFHIRVPER